MSRESSRGSSEATKQAASLIAAMIRDPEADISALLPRAKLPPPQPAPAHQPKPKQTPVKVHIEHLTNELIPNVIDSVIRYMLYQYNERKYYTSLSP